MVSVSNQMVLSIIVPVYNVEAFLRKCVGSLLDQDLSPTEYEIILVDDGSSDKSGQLCDRLAQSNDNIRVIHQQNRGLSGARNTGIAAASGQYIQFVDSDDYLEPNVLDSLVSKMDSGRLDVLRFDYRNVNDNYEVIDPNKTPKTYVDYSGDICDGQTFLTERLGFGCYACQFIIRRELLTDCRFKEDIYFEDSEWTPRMLLKAERVASTPVVVYNYLMRRGSITKSTDENKKLKALEDRMSLIDCLNGQKQGAGDKRWFDGMISHNALAIISDISQNSFDKRKYYIGELKKKGVFPLSKYHAGTTAIRKIRTANVSPMLLCLLLHLKNK